MDKDICIEITKKINDYFRSLGYKPNYSESSLGNRFNFCLGGTSGRYIFIYQQAFVGKHPNGKEFTKEYMYNELSIKDFARYIYEHINHILIKYQLNYDVINFVSNSIDKKITLQEYINSKNKL